MPYNPIESYGIIGDMHTVALVGMDGSIDWCCLPHFDSPSLFAAILDDKKGGSFRIASLLPGQRKQMYLPDTNVLVTRFLSAEGVGEVIDFMPIQDPGEAEGPPDRSRGQGDPRPGPLPPGVPARLRLRPPAAQGRPRPAWRRLRLRRRPGGADQPVPPLARSTAARWSSSRSAPARARPSSSARSRAGGATPSLLEARLQGEEALHRTVRFWRGWLSGCRYAGRWREMVHRSALVLKLLTFEPTGAIVAAPTTQPARGDSAACATGTTATPGSATPPSPSTPSCASASPTRRPRSWAGWSSAQGGAGQTGPLQIMYGIDGRHELPEETLDHLDGYRGSQPGPHRQRRRRPAPARHLRRADRLDLPLQQVRLADLLRLVDAHPPDGRLGLRQLAAHRRGHLGGARRAAAVRLLQDAVLGGARPAPPPGRRAQLPPRPAPAGRPARPHLRSDHDARLRREAEDLRAVLRHRRPGRLQPDHAAGPLHRRRTTRACWARSTARWRSWCPTAWSTATRSARGPATG